MNALFLKIFIVLLLIVVGCFIAIVYLHQTARAIKNENRFKNFSLKSNQEDELSFFEKIYHYLWQKVQILGNHLNKTKYAKYYEKFAINDEVRGCDYLALKIIISFLSLFLIIAFTIFNFNFIYLFGYLIVFLISFFVIDFYLKIIQQKKQRIIKSNLLKAIVIMNNDFQNNKTILQALNSVCKELDPYTAFEFQKVIKDISYGIDIDIAFTRLYQRVCLEELSYIATSLAIYNQMGGNIKQTFTKVEQYLKERQNFKTEIYNYQVVAKWLKQILILLPIIIFGILALSVPNYFVNYFTKKMGLILLIAIILLC